MNVLVTGGAGFIGSHVVDLLAHEGHNVMVLDNFWTGQSENLRPLRENVWITNQTITNPLDLSFAPWRAEAILHLAAQASITTSLVNTKYDLQTNALGTYHVIKAARELGVRRIVMASTSAVYEEKDTLLRETDTPNPGSPYGISKLAGEGYLRALFPEHVILRLGNVYGPRQVSIGENQVVARMINHALCGSNFFIHGDGNQKRDYVYVQDVARAFYAAIDADPGTYNIGIGHSVSVNGVAATLSRVLNQEIDWQHDNLEDSRRDVRLAVKLAQSKLGWESEVGLTEGLRRTVEWEKANAEGRRRNAE